EGSPSGGSRPDRSEACPPSRRGGRPDRRALSVGTGARSLRSRVGCDISRVGQIVTSPLVVAVVLNWNLADVASGCVGGRRASPCPRLQVVVVDNGSSDGSVERLRAKFSDVDVLALPENRGYAAGVNVGIRRALTLGADWVVLVNNDAEVAPQAITKLVAAAGSTIGLVTLWIDALPSGYLWHAGACTSRFTLFPYELGLAELAKGRT